MSSPASKTTIGEPEPRQSRWSRRPPMSTNLPGGGNSVAAARRPRNSYTDPATTARTIRAMSPSPMRLSQRRARDGELSVVIVGPSPGLSRHRRGRRQRLEVGDELPDQRRLEDAAERGHPLGATVEDRLIYGA